MSTNLESPRVNEGLDSLKNDANALKKEVEEKAKITETDLKNFENFDFNSVGGFYPEGDPDQFIFNRGIEKSDNRGEYITLGGKKIYKLGNNKDGIFYQTVGYKGKGSMLAIGKFEKGKMNGPSVIVYSSGAKYVGEMKDGFRWTGKDIINGKVRVEYHNGKEVKK